MTNRSRLLSLLTFHLIPPLAPHAILHSYKPHSLDVSAYYKFFISLSIYQFFSPSLSIIVLCIGQLRRGGGAGCSLSFPVSERMIHWPVSALSTTQQWLRCPQTNTVKSSGWAVLGKSAIIFKPIWWISPGRKL